MFKLLITIFLLVFALGCSGNQKAQKLALHTLKSTIEYEKDVQEKVNAEKKFYRDQLATLREQIGCKNIGERVNSDKKPDKTVGCKIFPDGTTEIEKTLLYIRLESTTHRDAQIFSGEILSKNPLQYEGQTLRFLEEGLKKEQDTYLVLVKKRKQLEVDFLKNLEKLDQQKEKLKTVRKKLITLSTSPDMEVQLKQIIEFGKVIQGELAKTPKPMP